MDRSIGTVAQPRIQDVTDQINKSHLIYGCSDNTATHGIASAKCFNYAFGNTMQKAGHETVGSVPYNLGFKDAVGLFGPENYFFRVDLEVDGEYVFKTYEPLGWESAEEFTKEDTHPLWEPYEKTEDTTAGDYEHAVMTPPSLPDTNGYLSVTLENKGVDNIYVDDWLDVRLYTEDRIEHPYNLMFVPKKSKFYIGIHARNTRRLPYDIEVIIGEQYLEYDAITDKRFIMDRITY